MHLLNQPWNICVECINALANNLCLDLRMAEIINESLQLARAIWYAYVPQ
jgi:hypothetical protein